MKIVKNEKKIMTSRSLLHFQYFYHPNDHWVLERDIPGPTKVGDLVLMEKLREPYTELIHYHIKDIVFKEGEVYDPVTGRRCRGKMYSDGGNINFNRLEEEKMHMMQMDGGEMYEGGAGDMGDDDRDDFVDDARLSRRQKKRMGISNSANIDEKRETEKEGHLDYVHWNEYDRWIVLNTHVELHDFHLLVSVLCCNFEYSTLCWLTVLVLKYF